MAISSKMDNSLLKQMLLHLDEEVEEKVVEQNQLEL